MFIKGIFWIDREAKEAEVLVTDNSIELLCFSHPFKGVLNEEITEPLYGLNVRNIVLSDELTPQIQRVDDGFGYFIRGILHDKDRKLVIIGGIKIVIDDGQIPKDICSGEYIDFEVSRIDLYHVHMG